MAHAQESQLQIRGIPDQESGDDDSRDGPKAATRRSMRGSVRWWMTVVADMLMVLCGQTVATLLGRLYYNSGGNSKWMATLTQSGGAPLLVIPLLLTPPPSAEENQPAPSKMVAIYMGIGVMVGFDNLMYSYALQYLPVSTFSLVAATQLAFNAVTSRLINAQRFTALIANSVVVLTFSAALLGVGSSSDETSSNVPRGKYPVGFVLTLAASAVFALILSLFEVSFEKVIKARTLRWVLKMQLYTSLVASAVSVAGLFASWDWRTIPGEMASFKNGRARYVLTLVGTAVSWQAAAVGAVRLIARVSSLFANVTGTLALPLVPVFAVALFGDRMTGIKAVAILMAVWGFLSYVYQHYVDGRRGKAVCRACAARTGSDAVLPA
ncbi:probable purine permease 11 isoform X2 [Phragmites australis]|uniref:probable purine permease 11 isoform X2 n=1 Tax=Phragmites australis TaxID=29695 RepID=UPI002D7653BF|nr:probable purine permease 11 isoform X2 [Phragmites australis]